MVTERLNPKGIASSKAEIRLVEGTATSATGGAPDVASESKSALPPGQSSAQSEADAAHHYLFKEEPPNYGTEEDAKPKE